MDVLSMLTLTVHRKLWYDVPDQILFCASMNYDLNRGLLANTAVMKKLMSLGKAVRVKGKRRK